VLGVKTPFKTQTEIRTNQDKATSGQLPGIEFDACQP